MCCTLYIGITIIFFTYFWLQDYHVKHLLHIKLSSYSQWADYIQFTVKASPIYTQCIITKSAYCLLTLWSLLINNTWKNEHYKTSGVRRTIKCSENPVKHGLIIYIMHVEIKRGSKTKSVL